MGWNNDNYNGYSNNRRNGGYSNGYQRGGNYNGNGGYQNRGGQNRGSNPPKKRTGAKWHQSTKNGKPVITAWNASRKNGLLKILIAPYRDTHQVTSKSGRVWENWMCKVEGVGKPSDHFPVLVDTTQQKAIIKKYGWVVNCRAKNGGYCGSFTE